MDSNTQLVTRYYQAINDARWDDYDQFFAPDAKLEAFGGVEGVGPDAMRGFDQIWKRAASGFTITPVTTASEGDRVLCEIRVEGVHDGVLDLPTGPVPATGTLLAGVGVGVFELKDGRIVAQRIYFDRMIIAEALGLLDPSPA
jgi:ketosteroid isomerase-like protein